MSFIHFLALSSLKCSVAVFYVDKVRLICFVLSLNQLIKYSYKFQPDLTSRSVIRSLLHIQCYKVLTYLMLITENYIKITV